MPTSAPVAAAVDLGLDFSEQDTSPVADGAGANMTFWVPVDAPWSTFPDDGWQGCSQAQYAWLVGRLELHLLAVLERECLLLACQRAID